MLPAYTSLRLYKPRDFGPLHFYSLQGVPKNHLWGCVLLHIYAYWPYKKSCNLAISFNIPGKKFRGVIWLYSPMNLCFSVDISCSENISNTRPKIKIGIFDVLQLTCHIWSLLFNECPIYDKLVVYMVFTWLMNMTFTWH